MTVKLRTGKLFKRGQKMRRKTVHRIKFHLPVVSCWTDCLRLEGVENRVWAVSQNAKQNDAALRTQKLGNGKMRYKLLLDVDQKDN